MSKDLALEQTMWDIHTNTDIVPLEFTEEIKPSMYGLELQQASEINRGLEVTISERQVLIDAYIDVIKLEITAENLQTFKDLRLKLVKIRTRGLDIWKKNEKAVSIAKNNYVDAIYKSHIDINEAMELKLMEAEKFFDNQQMAIAKELNDARLERLQPYVANTTGLDFAQMNDYDFDDFVAGKKVRFEKEAEELIAENERVENEKLAEIKRQKAIESENAKLKADAEAKQAIQDAKDAKIENERKAEKAKADAIEKQLQGKIDNENAIIAKAKLDAENLAKAGVNEQLTKWINSFEIIIPTHLIENEKANEIFIKFNAFKAWSRKQI